MKDFILYHKVPLTLLAITVASYAYNEQWQVIFVLLCWIVAGFFTGRTWQIRETNKRLEGILDSVSQLNGILKGDKK